MELKNRTIITENNFIGTVTHLKNDMFLYHRKNEEQFKSQNWVDYCLAVEFDGKLYDCQTRAVTQYNDNYDFKNAVDEALVRLEKNNVTGLLNDYLKLLVANIENERWLPIWLLPLVKHFDGLYNTHFYDKAIKVREEIKRSREEENKKRQKEYDERQHILEEKKEIERLEKEKENYCYGFTDNLKPMQKQKVADTLNKKFRYDGSAVLKRKDFILRQLKDGFEPINKCFYNGKSEYRLQKDNGFYKLTKTEFDYANYLLNYGLENTK